MAVSLGVRLQTVVPSGEASVTNTRVAVMAAHKRSLILFVLLAVVTAVCGLLVAGTLTGCGASSVTTGPSSSLQANLNGAGATFPQPLYLEWIGSFRDLNRDVKINYQGIGSGGGIQQFTQLTVDFGASDAPMKDEEVAAAEQAAGSRVLHIPTVFGAVVIAFNVEGLDDLKLDQEALAGIFLGEIARWNDAKLVALNPDAALPDQAIQVAHRSDASGTTNIFTSYLSHISSRWKDSVGKGKEVKWPVGVGGQGNDGVSAVIMQQPGTLGYVELSYALESGMPVATLKNRAGNFIIPSLESTSAAAVGVEFPEDLRFDLSDSAGADAYPIVGATWILAYEEMKDPAKAEAFKAFLAWALENGAEVAEELHYAPLPEGLKAKALEKVNSIH